MNIYQKTVALLALIAVIADAFHVSLSSSVRSTTIRKSKPGFRSSLGRQSFGPIPGEALISNPTRNILHMSGPIPSLDLEDEDEFMGMKPKVYPERWVQLAYLSLLALLSDWVCFSVAAAPSVYESIYPGHSAASLIDIFLFTNVASSFVVTDSVRNFGLEKCIKFASGLMAAGCLLRCGLDPFLSLLTNIGKSVPVDNLVPTELLDVAAQTTLHSPAYPLILAGTILVGISQPFFQCTPPLLSAIWFGADERATSTAVALNFNQIGIATAFLVGGTMATTPEGLANYFALIAVLTGVVTVGTLVQFKNKPPSPPST